MRKDEELIKTQHDFEEAVKGLFNWFRLHVKCPTDKELGEKFKGFAMRYLEDTTIELIINIKEKNNEHST